MCAVPHRAAIWRALTNFVLMAIRTDAADSKLEAEEVGVCQPRKESAGKKRRLPAAVPRPSRGLVWGGETRSPLRIPADHFCAASSTVATRWHDLVCRGRKRSHDLVRRGRGLLRRGHDRGHMATPATDVTMAIWQRPP